MVLRDCDSREVGAFAATKMSTQQRQERRFGDDCEDGEAGHDEVGCVGICLLVVSSSQIASTLEKERKGVYYIGTTSFFPHFCAELPSVNVCSSHPIAAAALTLAGQTRRLIKHRANYSLSTANGSTLRLST